jgi:hypothetical protein
MYWVSVTYKREAGTDREEVLRAFGPFKTADAAASCISYLCARADVLAARIESDESKVQP